MLTISPIPAFSDNYIWAIQAIGHNECTVVDPGDAGSVEQYLTAHKLQLTGILITHHHFDHTGGVSQLVRQRDIPVYGPENCKAQVITHALQENDTLTIHNTPFTVISTPGHTLDHIAYFSGAGNTNPILFCGDTLFSAGCGRLFEGTPGQMQQSLDKLSRLPENTRIYCAHEYTRANLAFAIEVEPENPWLKARLTEVEQLRRLGKETLPSSIGLEKRTNPFLRTREKTIINTIQDNTDLSNPPAPGEVLGIIRQWKDQF